MQKRVQNIVGYMFVLGLLCTVFSVLADAYTYSEIVVPGLTNTTASGINIHGDIVGWGTGGNGVTGFLDSGGAFTLLTYPGASGTRATGINDGGDIVGTYTDSAGSHGFKYSAGAWTSIDAPPPGLPNTTSLTAINDVGQIAGSAKILYPGTSLPSPVTGFVDTSGTFSFVPVGAICTFDINGVNDSSVFAGSYGCSEVGGHPASGTVTSNSQNTALNNQAFFTGINDGGQVLLVWGAVSYLQSNPSQTTVGPAIYFQGSSATIALGINNSANIVGYFVDSAKQDHAFVATIPSAPTCTVSIQGQEMLFVLQASLGLAQAGLVPNTLNVRSVATGYTVGQTSPWTLASYAIDTLHTASSGATITDQAGNTSTCASRVPGTGQQWTGLNGVLTTSAAVGTNSDGALDAFALGSDSTLWHIAQTVPAGPWDPWGGFGGSAFAGEPAVARDSSGLLEILVVAGNGTLWHIAQTSPGNWAGSAWQIIPTAVKGRPALIVNANGQLQAFVRYFNDTVLCLTQNSPGSSSWSTLSLGGVIASNPAAILDATGTAQVVALGTDQALWKTSVTANGDVAPWQSVGASLQGDPSFLANGTVFARGTDNAVWLNWKNGNSWNGWQSLGGQIVNNPRGVENSDGRIEVFAAGTDNAVWHTAQITGLGSEWSPWSSLGGVISGDVVPAVDASGSVNIFARGSDSGLWVLTQPSPGMWD